MNHQFSYHWIRMHVLQFFAELLPRVNVEIVEPSLPKRPYLHRAPWKCQGQLPRGTLLPFPAKRSGNFLLQHLQYFRGRAFLRLAEKQVNVFRHHYIANQLERVPGTYFVEYSDETIPSASLSKKLETTKTPTPAYLQIAMAIIA